MKYPYIGKSKHSDNVVLFKSRSFGVSINSGSCTYIDDWDESVFKNITHEYLSNTWGVVESKEHAEFIVELAELHGFKLSLGSKSYDSFFVIDNMELGFLGLEKLAKIDCKQITIPLPPKAKEWEPEVGDEVLICNLESDSRLIDFNNEVVDVIATSKDGRRLILTISHPLHGIGAAVFIGKNIKKPKSKQDLLIEELQTKLCNNNAVDNYILACDIINGEIKGLSYE